jgi:cell division septation protein DedD
MSEKDRQMKKIRNFVFVLTALLLLPNASVWEGAVAAAAQGDLPDEGYYAATNSFPRNTVVDVVNLENGKSVRAIVATSLDTPGLLAVLSRDAASGIGLQPRSIGRIRVTQPSDPIAFSRFTEGLATSGDPDYDPRAMVASDAAGNDTADMQAAAKAPPAKKPLPSISMIQPPAGSSAGPASGDYPYLGYTIVDVPNAYPGAGEGAYKDPSLVRSAPETKTGPSASRASGEDEWDGYWDSPAENGRSEFAGADEEDSPESTLYPIWARGGSVDPIDAIDTVDLADAEAGQKQASDYLPPESDPVILSADPGAPYLPADKNAAPGSPGPGPYDLALVPAEQRPPDEYSEFNIPSEAIIGPIEKQPAQARTPSDYMDESLFIGPIEKPAPAQPAEPYPSPDLAAQYPPVAPDPVVQYPAETAAAEALPQEEEPPYSDFTEFAAEDVDQSSSEHAFFSVPLVSTLERGKYYLQLGAFSRAASVEDALIKIDKSFPLAVQAGGSADKPLYRILIGPVNQGESGALLQRFKRGGYSDAFVKSN